VPRRARSSTVLDPAQQLDKIVLLVGDVRRRKGAGPDGREAVSEILGPRQALGLANMCNNSLRIGPQLHAGSGRILLVKPFRLNVQTK